MTLSASVSRALPENVALVRSALGERAEAYGLAAALVADLALPACD